MHSTTGPETCDVVDCGRPATDNFVHVEQQRVLGFRICDPHVERFRAGERPVVADPASSVDRRPVLTMAPLPSPDDTDRAVEGGR